jgi:oligo-1,6-glucosidase
MVDLEEAKLLCDESRGELNMLFYFDHLEVDRRVAQFIPKKFRARKLLDVMTKWQRGLDWNAVYLENHDQARTVSHFGAAEKERDSNGIGRYWQYSAKMLALFELTLRGTPFIYQGQEIGMTNFDFKSMDEVDDVVSLGLDRLMKKMRVPAFLRWKWIKASSRDNARTPMQWNESENAGFSRGKPWLGVNGNYRQINYAAQKDDPESVLNFYKTVIALRKKSDCLIYGKFIPIFADNRLLIYQRKLNDEKYTVALNFSSRRVRLPKKVAGLLGEPVISTWTDFNVGPFLDPWEGVLFRN